MVIVHVTEPFATGINTFLQELIFSMPEYEHIIIHGERDDTRDINEIKFEYKGKVKFIKWEHAHREISIVKDIKAYFHLRKILKSIDFDVLHLHSSKAGVLGRCIGLKRKYKNIVYTPNAASFLRTDISKLKRKVYTLIEKFSNLSGAQIVSSSNSEYVAYKNIGIQSKIIQNGVTISKENQEIESQDGNFNIVFCGKVTVQKNPELFNEIALFYKDIPNVKFYWIGDGEMKESLTSDNIQITGWQKKNFIYSILAKSDLYLSTSSWEGLSIATIEASAFGLPLVLSRCVGNQDMVLKDYNGFLFSSKAEAIERIEILRNNKGQKDQISQNSKTNYNKQFGNYRCGLEYKKLYLEITDHK